TLPPWDAPVAMWRKVMLKTLRACISIRCRGARRPPGQGRRAAGPCDSGLRRQPLLAQPPALLLQSGWTAKLPVGRLIAFRFCQAQRSPISSPLGSTQPLDGSGSVTASAYSWPPTMLKPSSWFCTELAPQLEPASSTYGMLVYAVV